MAIPDPLPDFVVTPLGLAFTAVALVVGYEGYSRGRSPWSTAVALAAAAVVDGYAGILTAFALTFFLHESRRPLRTLAWLGLAVAAAAGLAGFALVPWIVEWARDPREALPLSAAPIFAWPLASTALLAGLCIAAVVSKRGGGLDRRVAFLASAVAIVTTLPAVLPTLPPQRSPLEFCGGRGGSIGLGLTVVSAVTMALVAAKDRRNARMPAPKPMPRALTPALLEMSPPPPSPTRWGGLVVPILWASLIVWRFLRVLFL